MEVQDVSLCFSMFKESICAGDTNVAQRQRTPLHLTFAYVLHPSIFGVTQSYSILAIPLCGHK